MLKINFKECLLGTGDLNPKVRHARFAAVVVEHASADASYPLVCRERFGTAECDGVLALGYDGKVISWQCTRCDDAGKITGWNGSRWDFEQVPPATATGLGCVSIVLPVDELLAVRVLAHADDVRLPMARAKQSGPARARVQMPAELLDSVAARIRQAADAVGGAEQRCLDRATGRIEMARDSASSSLGHA